jgi:hypothetical protein
VGQDYVGKISALKPVVLGTAISVGDLQDILARRLKAITADKQDTIKVLLIKIGKILKWVLNKNGTLTLSGRMSIYNRHGDSAPLDICRYMIDKISFAFL